MIPDACRFDRDLRWRTRIRIIPVECRSCNGFQITREALEAAYQKAQEDNIKVKGLIVTNPSNPLGTTLSRKTLTSLVRFVNEKNIHLVADEIYAATVFSRPRFVSVSEIIEEVECNRDLIHIVYSLSKDLGLPGFRVGIVYSYNDVVVSCARKMSSFGLVSSQTQHLLASMLSDDEFVDKFLTQSYGRLARRHKSFTEGLAEVGINCLKGNAGLFVWMDLGHLLKKATVEGEIELWHLIIKDVKLNVSPGSSFHCADPGLFRVCFANMDEDTVEVALKRIIKFVRKGQEAGQAETQAPTKAKRWKNNTLRLSFSSRIYDETVMTPLMMSPHSPIAHSPLVRART